MNVLVYDGDCNMCSRLIRYIVKINQNNSVFITDLNSDWTKRHIKLNRNIDSVVYVKGFNRFIYSDAVIYLLMDVHWLFKPVIALKVIPRTLRDRVYKWVASNRKRLFKSGQCEMPGEAFKRMYLN